VPLMLDIHANGETIGIHRGTTVIVTLASNPSTGYSWKLDAGGGRVVRLVSHRYVPPAKQVPGAGGREVWRFVASTRGATKLALGYLRPWAPKHVVRWFRVTFRVT